jgi:hypothetical protein
MAKTKISEFSSTPANNTDIDGININEGCAPSGINDAIRELMAQLKDWQSGASNDPYVVGSSGSLTLNQGTANGVAYLNGSKVVTSGSGLVFDGAALGVGATPSAWGGTYKAIDLGTIGSVSSTSAAMIVGNNFYFDGTSTKYKTTAVASRYNQTSGSHTWQTAVSGTAGDTITFTTSMVLDTNSNLGLGGSASSLWSGWKVLQVGSVGALGGTTTQVAVSNNWVSTSITDKYIANGYANVYTQVNGQHIWYNAPTGTAGADITFTQAMTLNASGNLGIGTSSPATRLDVATPSGTAALISTTITGAQRWQFGVEEVNGNYVIKNQTGATTPVVISTTGNLGLGVTPSAWGTSGTLQAIQIKNTAIAGSGANAYWGANWFGGGFDKYIQTGAASLAIQTGGSHIWYNAPSGTAGNAITFTQAMTLDADGDLGIGTTSPSYKLDVAQSNPTRGIVAQIQNTASSGQTGTQLEFLQGGVDYWSIGQPAGVSAFAFWGGRYSGGDGTEIMRLTNTGNVGIGTSSPSAKLTISGTAATGATTFLSTGTTTNYNVGQFTNTGGSFYFGLDNNAGTAFTGSSAYGGIVGTGNSTSLGLVTNSVVRATIDSSGNLGLGVTPVSPDYRSISVSYSGHSLIARSSNLLTLSMNAYYNSGFKYSASSVGASLYEQNNGNHNFYTAPSGTAGNAITFTQAMTLTAAGKLLVGFTTAPTADASLFGNGIQSTLTSGGGGFANLPLSSGGQAFYTHTGVAGSETYTERARIDSSGNFLIGKTTSGGQRLQVEHSVNSLATVAVFRNSAATASNQYGIVCQFVGQPNNSSQYFFRCDDDGGNTERLTIRSNGGIANYSANNVNLSDERTKTDIQNAGSYLDKICAIPVRTFKYKDQSDDLLNLGVIAQEVEAVAPELVDVTGFGETPEDGVPLKAIYQTDLQYALMKALQELKAEFDAYKASHP